MVLVETAIYSKYGKTKKSLGLIIAYNILWAAGVAAAGSYLKSRAELTQKITNRRIHLENNIKF